MYDFSNLSDNELAAAFEAMAAVEGAWEVHIFRAAARELDRRIHAIVPDRHWVVKL